MPLMETSTSPRSLGHFGPLAFIEKESLVKLASRIRKDVHGVNPTGGRLIRRIDGEYNIIHIIELNDFKTVIRVPATGHGAGMTLDAANMLRSTVATLRFLELNTTIPAPRVYDFDTTKKNEIGAPYICMSFIEGENLSDTWFDNERDISLEERRLNALNSLAEAMAQLAPCRFDQMGSIVEESDGEFIVGSSYQLSCDERGVVRASPYGPYNSWSEFLKENLEPSEQSEASDFWAKGKTKMITTMTSFMPCHDDTDGFVMSLPDSDLSNFLVDSQGKITGIIDWDGALIVPVCIGYGSYPSFITRDWDPISYELAKLDIDTSFPIKLENYRDHYYQKIGRALNGHEDWKWVEKSHIRQAVFLAAIDESCRQDICRKFIEEITGHSNARVEIFHIGQGRYDDAEWGELEMGLKQLIYDD